VPRQFFFFPIFLLIALYQPSFSNPFPHFFSFLFCSFSSSPYRYSYSNHSPPFLAFLLSIIPDLTVTIPPTLPLPFYSSSPHLLFYPTLLILTVTFLPTLSLPFWLFFSPLFHTLVLQFLQPFLSRLTLLLPILFYKFAITSSIPLSSIPSMFYLKNIYI
jgi:hypothetical protein